MKLDELATFGAIALLFVLMAYAIITTAEQSAKEREQETISKGWTPRSIPVCDIELWDRIRGECSDSRASNGQHLEAAGEGQ